MKKIIITLLIILIGLCSQAQTTYDTGSVSVGKLTDTIISGTILKLDTSGHISIYSKPYKPDTTNAVLVVADTSSNPMVYYIKGYIVGFWSESSFLDERKKPLPPNIVVFGYKINGKQW